MDVSFFLVLINENIKSLLLYDRSKNLLSWVYDNSLELCHILVHKDLNFLNIRDYYLHYIHVMLSGSVEQQIVGSHEAVQLRCVC